MEIPLLDTVIGAYQQDLVLQIRLLPELLLKMAEHILFNSETNCY